MRQSIRVFGFLVCAAAALIVFVVLAPKVAKSTPTLPNATQYQSLIVQALADDKTNNLLTAGAPQQAVVNGWTARDLLTIIAKEDQDILTAQGAVVDATGTLQTTPFDDRILPPGGRGCGLVLGRRECSAIGYRDDDSAFAIRSGRNHSIGRDTRSRRAPAICTRWKNRLPLRTARRLSRLLALTCSGTCRHRVRNRPPPGTEVPLAPARSERRLATPTQSLA